MEAHSSHDSNYDRQNRKDKVYLYDIRKKNGYRYNEHLLIYEPVNKSHILHVEHKYDLIDKDIRPYIDLLPPDEIPISSGQMFNGITKEVRLRDAKDYVTYVLPNFLSGVNTEDVRRVEETFQGLCPDSWSSLRETIRDFLCGRGSDYVLFEGPKESFEQIKETLLMLYPLVDECSSRLYTEVYHNRKPFEDIASARLVLTSIGERTLRKGNYNEFINLFPIQFRGMVHRDHPTSQRVDAIQMLSKMGASFPSSSMTAPVRIYKLVAFTDKKPFRTESLLSWIFLSI